MNLLIFLPLKIFSFILNYYSIVSTILGIKEATGKLIDIIPLNFLNSLRSQKVRPTWPEYACIFYIQMLRNCKYKKVY